jgi:hypothetical protein
VIELAFGAHAVFFTGRTRLERAKAAELAFNGHAARMRHLDDTAVTSTLYSYEAGVLPSSFKEPSIITDENPSWMERWHTAGLVPWSWCMTIGMCGHSSIAA